MRNFCSCYMIPLLLAIKRSRSEKMFSIFFEKDMNILLNNTVLESTSFLLFQSSNRRNILRSSSFSRIQEPRNHHNRNDKYNSNNNSNSSSFGVRKKNNDNARASHLCQIDCNKEKKRPVCGLDNITYPSRCHLHQTICNGNQVRLQYRGECSQRKFRFI